MSLSCHAAGEWWNYFHIQHTYSWFYPLYISDVLSNAHVYVGMYVSFTYNTLGLSKHFVGVKSNFPSMIGDDICCVFVISKESELHHS